MRLRECTAHSPAHRPTHPMHAHSCLSAPGVRSRTPRLPTQRTSKALHETGWSLHATCAHLTLKLCRCRVNSCLSASYRERHQEQDTRRRLIVRKSFQLTSNCIHRCITCRYGRGALPIRPHMCSHTRTDPYMYLHNSHSLIYTFAHVCVHTQTHTHAFTHKPIPP